jgi:CRISPR-associated protein Cas5d
LSETTKQQKTKNMSNKIYVRVKGSKALWTSPSSKRNLNKESYAFPTASGLQGLLKSIYWKPEFEYEIIRCKVVNPIRFMTIGKTPFQSYDDAFMMNDKATRVPSVYRYLNDVDYVIEARIVGPDYTRLEWEEVRKHTEMFNRYIPRPRLYPFLGTSECEAFTERVESFDSVEAHSEMQLISGSIYMFHTFAYPKDSTPRFFANSIDKVARFENHIIENGVINYKSLSY